MLHSWLLTHACLAIPLPLPLLIHQTCCPATEVNQPNSNPTPTSMYGSNRQVSTSIVYVIVWNVARGAP